MSETIYSGRSKHRSIWWRYGFAWVTGALFFITLSGHWIFGWFAYANEQRAHNHPVSVSEYTVQMGRDTLENWQSEFLQLLWQVAGLALLLHVGSPQSKEGDDRMEAKLDAILLAVEPKKGDALLSEIDQEYEGRHTMHGSYGNSRSAKRRAPRESLTRNAAHRVYVVAPAFPTLT